MNSEGVSIIICCYNSSPRIGETLRHLQKIKANGISWEVVLVDNASDDDTAAKARELWDADPVVRLQIVNETEKGLMHARRRGAQAASYDVFSFIDDDNWVEEGWVQKVHFIHKNDDTLAACGGSSEAVFETTPPSWFPEFSRSYATGVQQNETGFVKPEKGYLWGAGLTVKKQAWDALFSAGFRSLLPGRSGKALTAGEDSEICLAWVLLGWKLWYDESLKLKHFIPAARLNLDYLVRMYEGFGKAEVILSLYRSLINNTKANKSSWFLQYLTSLKELFQVGVSVLFSSPKRKLRKWILWKHHLAYTREFFHSRKKYLAAQKQINEFFSSAPVLNTQKVSAIR